MAGKDHSIPSSINIAAPADGGAPKYRLCWLTSSEAGAQSLRGGRGARAPQESFRAATGKPRA
jgi:hypothetical protein